MGDLPVFLSCHAHGNMNEKGYHEKEEAPCREPLGDKIIYGHYILNHRFFAFIKPILVLAM
jgi:hypothetical protein